MYSLNKVFKNLENEFASTPNAHDAIVSIVNLPNKSFKSTIPFWVETFSAKMSISLEVVSSMKTFIAFILPEVKIGEKVDLINKKYFLQTKFILKSEIMSFSFEEKSFF
jgi:hypothetical protein